jgi:hypothetical protein
MGAQRDAIFRLRRTWQFRRRRKTSWSGHRENTTALIALTPTLFASAIKK